MNSARSACLRRSVTGKYVDLYHPRPEPAPRSASPVFMRLANYLSKENSSLLVLVAIVRLARDVVPAYDDPKRTNRCLLFLGHVQYCFDGGHLLARRALARITQD